MCPDCDRGFATCLLLLRHRSGKHGYRAPARLFAQGHVCGACGTDFGVRPRLIRHLAYGRPECLVQLQESVPPLAPAAAAALDEAD